MIEGLPSCWRGFLYLANLATSVYEYAAANSDSPTTEVQEDPAGDPLNIESSDNDEDSDIDLLLDNIRDPIDQLYKLSIWIRNPSSRFASSKATSLSTN